MIAIVIVGYNNAKHLPAYFLSIRKSGYKDYQIIFVDNNSQDNSLKLIQKNYPEIITIKNPKNLGFAAGNNIGIQKALELGADYVFLLNPDTIIDPGCLEELSKDSETKTVLQPVILLYKRGKTNQINTTGNPLHFLGFSYCGDYQKKWRGGESKEIATASGAAMFIPRPVIEKIGLFDEQFFAYHEDVDFSWRARLLGFKIKLCPRAKVWHKYSFYKNPNKFFYTERNRLLFLLKNYQLKTLLLISPVLLIHELMSYLYAFKNGWFFLRLKASWSFLTLLLNVLKKRNQIQKKRKFPDRRLEEYLIAEIDFPEIKFPGQRVYNKLLRGFWCKIKPFI